MYVLEATYKIVLVIFLLSWGLGKVLFLFLFVLTIYSFTDIIICFIPGILKCTGIRGGGASIYGRQKMRSLPREVLLLTTNVTKLVLRMRTKGSDPKPFK